MAKLLHGLSGQPKQAISAGSGRDERRREFFSPFLGGQAMDCPTKNGQAMTVHKKWTVHVKKMDSAWTVHEKMVSPCKKGGLRMDSV